MTFIKINWNFTKSVKLQLQNEDKVDTIKSLSPISLGYPSSSKGMPIWNAYWYPFYTLETLTAFFAYKWCMEKCTDNMFYLRIDEWGCRPRWGGPATSPIFVPAQRVIFTIIVIGCSEVPCIMYTYNRMMDWYLIYYVTYNAREYYKINKNTKRFIKIQTLL